MTSNNSSRIALALRVTSYLLLLSGILMVLPFPIFSLIKVAAPGKVAMIFIMTGAAVLCIPLITLPMSALWVWKMNGNHDDKFHVLSRGCFRYFPALSLGFIEMIFSAKTGNAYLSLAFGAALIVYACVLLKIDSAAADA